MRILFGIMSAVQPVETVAALCDAIGVDHPILIHHDFSQQPDFLLKRINVGFVESPVRTGWADWGFTEGILKLVTTALERDDWDYFQLLSPTCLPIRPLRELEAHLAASPGTDYLMDAVDLAAEVRLLMSHGWRAYAKAGHWRHRVLRRMRRWYLGTDAPMANHRGLSFPVRSRVEAGGLTALKARLGLGVTRAAQYGLGFNHIFARDLHCYAGSTWFGASREGCRYLLEKTAERRLLHYFKGLHMADEMLFPTVFMNSPLKGAPALHHISRFVEARPAWIGLDDLEEVLASGKYFARKFPEDPASEVRTELARRLATGAGASVTAAPGQGAGDGGVSGRSALSGFAGRSGIAGPDVATSSIAGSGAELG
jgi:hypothetical protein